MDFVFAAVQLYISFQRHQGPWSITMDCGARQSRIAVQSVAAVRVKYFRLMFQQYLKDAEVQFCCSTVRPHSHWIACFRGAVGFHFSETEFNDVERVLAKHLTVPATGSGETLESLRGV
jgi:hypothetical protein